MGSDVENAYEDSLVEVSRDGLVLHHYYFPGLSRKVLCQEIDRIEMLNATMWTGKWRIWGTGDMRTWFPADLNRPGRDRVFIIHLKNRWRRIGFTVENPDHLTHSLQQIGIPIIKGE